MIPLSAHTKKFEASAASPQTLKKRPLGEEFFFGSKIFTFNTCAKISKKSDLFCSMVDLRFPIAPRFKTLEEYP